MGATETPPMTRALALTGHRGAVNVGRFNGSGQYCLTGGQDRTIRLWNTTTGEAVADFEGHGWDVLDLDVSPDNVHVASVGGDRAVFVWDVGTGKLLRKLPGHTQRVNAVNFNTLSSVIASGSFDKSVRLWDNRSSSRRPIQILDEAGDSVTSLASFGSELLVGSTDGFTRVYDVRRGQMTADFVGSPVTSVGYAQDGQCLLVSSLDSTVRLLDKAAGTLLNHYEGHRNGEYRLRSCLSRLDSLVISGSEDGRLWCWDLMEATCAREWQAHPRVVTCVAYHPTEPALLSTSVDGTVYIWR